MNYYTQLLTRPDFLPQDSWEKLMLGIYLDSQSGLYPPTILPFCCWTLHVDPFNFRIVSSILAFPEVSPTDLTKLRDLESSFLTAIREKFNLLFQ